MPIPVINNVLWLNRLLQSRGTHIIRFERDTQAGEMTGEMKP
jgi:hypothetical protein